MRRSYVEHSYAEPGQAGPSYSSLGPAPRRRAVEVEIQEWPTPSGGLHYMAQVQTTPQEFLEERITLRENNVNQQPPRSFLPPPQPVQTQDSERMSHISDELLNVHKSGEKQQQQPPVPFFEFIFCLSRKSKHFFE